MSPITRTAEFSFESIRLVFSGAVGIRLEAIASSDSSADCFGEEPSTDFRHADCCGLSPICLSQPLREEDDSDADTACFQGLQTEVPGFSSA